MLGWQLIERAEPSNFDFRISGFDFQLQHWIVSGYDACSLR